MDSGKIKVIFIVVGALFFAVYLGVASATAKFEAIAWVGGTVLIGALLAMGRHVWVLIPVSAALYGNVNLLPGSPPLWWATTAAVGGLYVARFLMRRHDLNIRLTWMDFAILLQAIAVGQAFLRNPAGLSILGGDTVGGKPYVAFAIAIGAYVLMSTIRAELKLIKGVVIATIVAVVLDGTLMMSSMFLPVLASAVIPIYSGVWFDSAVGGGGVSDVQSTRINAAKGVGTGLCHAAFTVFRPLTTVNPLKIVRFLLMAIGLYLVMIAGYRSNFILAGAFAVVGSLVRRRMLDVVVCGTAGLVALSLLAVTGTVKELPFGARRALAFLPVDVGQDAKHSADSTVDWRVEMWILALSSDRYIQNKLLGDGFNYRADELQAQQDALFGDTRRSTNFKGIDTFLARGSYHGFHVEAIRMTGAFGLSCALLGMGIFFRCAWRQIQYYRQHPEWPYILYITIPFLIFPFYYMLVFGSYKSDMPALIIMAGLLKMLDNIRVQEIADRASASAALVNQESASPNLPMRTTVAN